MHIEMGLSPDISLATHNKKNRDKMPVPQKRGSKMTNHRPKFSKQRRSLLKGLGGLGVGLTFLPRHSLSEEEKKLNFYNWDTYIGETTLADFEKATGKIGRASCRERV